MQKQQEERRKEAEEEKEKERRLDAIRQMVGHLLPLSLLCSYM